MRNKVKDVLYCNVDREKILNVSPIFNHENLWYFYEWLVERYKIHLKKDVEKMLPPWTTDKVLLKYRFTNVRREHDRETKWLINNICLNSNLSYENKLLNIILFRLFNKSRTIEIIGLADFEKLNFDEILKKISEFRESNEKYVWFSNAFFTSGPKSVSNKLFGEGDVVLNVIKLVERYNKLGIIDKIKLSGSQKEVYDNLLSLPGIGSFLAYQIFVDFSYLSEFPFSENEFVVAGPGLRGPGQAGRGKGSIAPCAGKRGNESIQRRKGEGFTGST